MSYSPFFQTLHDEPRPLGQFGRGTHYSVLRAPIWQDEWCHPLPLGGLLDFAVIWDADHDDRVIEVVEEMYFQGLLGPVRFIGERKGTLSVLLEPRTIEAWQERQLRDYRDALKAIGNHLDDPWPTTVDQVFGRRHSLIPEQPEDVDTYLRNIQLLWRLGRKPSLEYLQEARQKRFELARPDIIARFKSQKLADEDDSPF